MILLRSAVGIFLLAYLLYGIYLWARSKPKGEPWRCYAGFHYWEVYGYRMECRRCGKRRNYPTLGMAAQGLDRLLDKIGAMHAAKQQDWQTPPELFGMIEEALGFEFTLDPCTSPDNPLGTPKFYTEDDDGLKQSWRGERAYMNPPYGNLPMWVTKAWNESQWNDTTVVGLLPVRTSPKYMRHYVWTSYTKYLDRLCEAQSLRDGEIGVFFLPKRVRFIDPSTGKKTGSPYFDSMVVVWR